jgi:glycosyltransferase involved in cell wall biosynthesis
LRPKILIGINTAWNFYNFRAGLIRAMVKAGYEVVAVAHPDQYATRLADLGCRYVALPMDNQGTHPVRDLLLIWRFYKLLRLERPDVYLGYTIKPNIYGSLASNALTIPVINNIAGLGSVFIKENWLTRVISILYRISLSASVKVFFQNEEDRKLFISRGLVGSNVTGRLPGSGIDLERFSPLPLPNNKNQRFLLIARMLWEKGVGEFVEAARILKFRGITVDLCLLGFLDVRNPGAISKEKMDEWVDEGVVQYLGVSDNVAAVIATADCVVLPSFYREGVPKSLLEAAALGRPIITTDSVGCREVVDDGVNGYLVRPQDAIDLADKIALMSMLPIDKRKEMGLSGREKVENEFDEKIVIKEYLETIAKIIHTCK